MMQASRNRRLVAVVIVLWMALSSAEEEAASSRTLSTVAGLNDGAGITYEEIEGLLLDVDSTTQKRSRRGCELICNRVATCKSFSFRASDSTCVVSQGAITYDPDYTFNAKSTDPKKKGVYHKFEGMTYKASGWMKSTVKSQDNCADLCTQAMSCKAYTYRDRDNACFLSQHGIQYDSEYSYFEKNVMKKGPGDPVVKKADDHAVTEKGHMVSAIDNPKVLALEKKEKARTKEAQDLESQARLEKEASQKKVSKLKQETNSDISEYKQKFAAQLKAKEDDIAKKAGEAAGKKQNEEKLQFAHLELVREVSRKKEELRQQNRDGEEKLEKIKAMGERKVKRAAAEAMKQGNVEVQKLALAGTLKETQLEINQAAVKEAEAKTDDQKAAAKKTAVKERESKDALAQKRELGQKTAIINAASEVGTKRAMGVAERDEKHILGRLEKKNKENEEKDKIRGVERRNKEKERAKDEEAAVVQNAADAKEQYEKDQASDDTRKERVQKATDNALEMTRQRDLATEGAKFDEEKLKKDREMKVNEEKVALAKQVLDMKTHNEQVLAIQKRQMETRLRLYTETAERDAENFKQQAIKRKMDGTEPGRNATLNMMNASFEAYEDWSQKRIDIVNDERAYRDDMRATMEAEEDVIKQNITDMIDAAKEAAKEKVGKAHHEIAHTVALGVAKSRVTAADADEKATKHKTNAVLEANKENIFLETTLKCDVAAFVDSGAAPPTCEDATCKREAQGLDAADKHRIMIEKLLARKQKQLLADEETLEWKTINKRLDELEGEANQTRVNELEKNELFLEAAANRSDDIRATANETLAAYPDIATLDSEIADIGANMTDLINTGGTQAPTPAPPPSNVTSNGTDTPAPPQYDPAPMSAKLQEVYGAPTATAAASETSSASVAISSAGSVFVLDMMVQVVGEGVGTTTVIKSADDKFDSKLDFGQGMFKTKMYANSSQPVGEFNYGIGEWNHVVVIRKQGDPSYELWVNGTKKREASEPAGNGNPLGTFMPAAGNLAFSGAGIPSSGQSVAMFKEINYWASTVTTPLVWTNGGSGRRLLGVVDRDDADVILVDHLELLIAIEEDEEVANGTNSSSSNNTNATPPPTPVAFNASDFMRSNPSYLLAQERQNELRTKKDEVNALNAKIARAHETLDNARATYFVQKDFIEVQHNFTMGRLNMTRQRALHERDVANATLDDAKTEYTDAKGVYDAQMLKPANIANGAVPGTKGLLKVQASDDHNMNSFMKFPTEQLKTNDVIVKATLKVYKWEDEQGGIVRIDAASCAWNRETITYMNSIDLPFDRVSQGPDAELPSGSPACNDADPQAVRSQFGMAGIFSCTEGHLQNMCDERPDFNSQCPVSCDSCCDSSSGAQCGQWVSFTLTADVIQQARLQGDHICLSMRGGPENEHIVISSELTDEAPQLLLEVKQGNPVLNYGSPATKAKGPKIKDESDLCKERIKRDIRNTLTAKHLDENAKDAKIKIATLRQDLQKQTEIGDVLDVLTTQTNNANTAADMMVDQQNAIEASVTQQTAASLATAANSGATVEQMTALSANLAAQAEETVGLQAEQAASHIQGVANSALATEQGNIQSVDKEKADRVEWEITDIKHKSTILNIAQQNEIEAQAQSEMLRRAGTECAASKHTVVGARTSKKLTPADMNVTVTAEAATPAPTMALMPPSTPAPAPTEVADLGADSDDDVVVLDMAQY